MSYDLNHVILSGRVAALASPEGDFVLVQDDGTQINCRTNDGLFCSEVRAGHLVVLDGKLDAGGVVVITQWHLGRKRTRRSVTV